MSIVDLEGHTIDLTLSTDGAEHVSVVLLSCGRWEATYAVPQEHCDGIESPLSHACVWTEFRDAAERETHLAEYRLGERDFLVERHEHGSVTYALVGESTSCDRRWDVAVGVAVLRVPADIPVASRTGYARDLLRLYSQWCRSELWTGRRDLFDLNGLLLDFEDVHGFYTPAQAAESMRPRSISRLTTSATHRRADTTDGSVGGPDRPRPVRAICPSTSTPHPTDDIR